MTNYTYDALNRKTYESYPYVITRLGDTLTYDGLDRTKRITHPDNSYNEYIYNQSKVTLRNELGKNTEFQYIAFGDLSGENLLASVKDALNQTTNYFYDAANQITSLNAAGGYNRTYHYNTKYLLDYEITPECGQTNYVYDNAGNLIQKTDANGNSISFGYDNATRLTNEHYNGVAYSSFFYDDADNCSLYTTPTSACSLYYDELNRVIRKTLIIDNSSYAVSFIYDSRGNVERITYPDDSYVVYQYLENNWVSVVVDYTNGIIYHPSGKELSYYTNNGRGAHFEYNNRYRTSKITVDGNVLEEGYQYDYLGNLTNYTDYLNSANNQTFTYDDADRLKTFDGPWGSGTYNYTPGYAISRRSQEIIGSNTTNYYYDITNHRLSSTTGANPYTFTYANNGNLTGITNQMTMVYDIGNRPISINKFLGTTTYFDYDANGIRIKKELGVPPPLKLEGESVTTPSDICYYITGLNGEVLCEIQPTVPDKTFDNYIYLNGKKLCRKRGPNKYFYHSDFLGNTKAMTDNTGTKIYSWLGYPFGKQYSMTGGSYNNYRFIGKELDESTGFYFFGARYYMPEIGKFITPDPINGVTNLKLKKPMSLNIYNYALDNPLKYIDPTGASVVDVSHWTERINTWNTLVEIAIECGMPFEEQWKKTILTKLLQTSVDEQMESAIFGLTLGSIIIQETAPIKGIAQKMASGDITTFEKHHLLPKQFKTFFDRVGLNVEDFVVPMEKSGHRLKPYGLHTKSVNWNQLWENFIKQYPNPEPNQVLDYLQKLCKDYGIEYKP